MTRRMRDYYPTGVHHGEHNDTPDCRLGSPCRPLAPCDTVAVPATGTVLVIDGVVQDVKPEDVNVHRYGVGCGAAHLGPGSVTYTIAVLPPKPTFFEVGKQYRRHCQWSIWAHKEDVIETVEVTVADVDKWITLRPYDYGDTRALRQGQWEVVTDD
ncbi:hypothetical protein ACFTWD_01380 [Streptomyces sp. NPDC056943]|uniref:hypothetical protein n=1 Tax=Streptomyces sp. NPDC056943 TaxID=3345971 RepID=UPI00363780F0